jgi:tRNA-dihydrouridine synthase
VKDTARTIRAGGLELDNPLWLAPLAGVTMPPVRAFFSRLGAGLTHTEMVSCAGLTHGNRKTGGMLRVLPDEGTVVLQLFAGDAGTAREGAEAALSAADAANADAGAAKRPPFAALGINMACPMPKVTKRGAGAALMDAPDTARAMTRALKELNFPVWIKTRRAAAEADTLRFVEGLLEAGADNVCIHGRTPAQRYEGRADRAATVAAASRFPGKISASGDVRTTEDVLEYLGMGCVGVMAARGALADPYLFPAALRKLGYGVPEESANPPLDRRLAHLRELGERLGEVCGPRVAVVLLKRLLAGTLKGTEKMAQRRRRAAAAADFGGLMSALLAEEPATLS